MRGHFYRSNMYVKRYKGSKLIDLTRKKGNTNGPQQGRDGIAASPTEKRESGQRHTIEKMKRNTTNNFHRMVHPRLDRPRQVRARTQVPLHYPPKIVSEGWDGNRSCRSGKDLFLRSWSWGATECASSTSVLS